MAPTSKGWTLVSLFCSTNALTFNYGSFGPGEKVLIYDRKLERNTKVEAGLWNIDEEPDLSNYIQFDSCKTLRQSTFENSDEFLPLTAHGYYYLECEVDS